MNTILGLAIILFASKITLKVLGGLVFGKRRSKGKTISSKLWTLFAREIHHRLDKQLKKQAEKFHISTSENVVPFKKKQQKAT